MISCPQEFIGRWATSGGSERANFQRFAIELTQLLGVDEPKLATDDNQADDYRFERKVQFGATSCRNHGFIDLYRKGNFVLEAKQGVHAKARPDPNQLTLLNEDDAPQTKRTGHGARGTGRWAKTMLEARNQADNYARAVARDDGWPPFLLVVDVGHVIEVYADFSRQGQGYAQFPDGARYRIKLEDLADECVRERLKAIWEDPCSLDPAKVSARVTRKIADQLAALGKLLEADGHEGETVARFLMRCLFSIFAEDVELIPKNSFTQLLQRLRGHPEHAAQALQALWETMDTGGFSQALTVDLKRFNGGLFKESEALPLNEIQLSVLIKAAEADWREVEPAIFGTLLERALDKRQRHKLGAHYTPRAYVQRLVTPTIMNPLRADWRDVQAGVQRLTSDGKDDAARKLVRDFHQNLCEIRVLDPACGSGNFLYVAMEMMKRLEGEVVALLAELGEDQGTLGLAGHTVDPHQFLGIELNPWAAAVAELVLWIGYLQWHFRTYGKASPSEPVLRDFKNIECRDAVLEWSERAPRLDEAGNPVSRWDGITTITHNVTGEEVPDPDARVQVYDYLKPKAAGWPEADFIVGNPPFIGASRLRESLGDGYTEALWSAYPKMPKSADLVMFWWEKAALFVRSYNARTGKGTRRFGLITTNSLRQTFNRRVLELHLADAKKPLSLLFAIPDHPWVDTLYGAAVRIAMTVGAAGRRAGRLSVVVSEKKRKTEEEGREVTFYEAVGKVLPNLQIGADVAGAAELAANDGLAHMGVKLHGGGFIISNAEAIRLGFRSCKALEAHIRPFFNGRDLAQLSREKLAIDLFGRTESEVKEAFPAVYQHLRDTVWPERQQNNRASYRNNWWIFGEPRSELRPAVQGLAKFIVTTRTAKHRIFQFLSGSAIPESKLVAIAIDDSSILSVLSSRFHIVYAVGAGGWLGVGNDPTYNHSSCFNTFPFPDLTDGQRTHLRDLGEQLDAHRKRQQKEHPKLTLTQMYNVLENVRAGEKIEGKDKEIYDQGLIGILRDLHDQIDHSVADAYGWPRDLSDEDSLQRLVDLNHQRAAEEAKGHIRWLRPDYQNPKGKQVKASGAQIEAGIGVAVTLEKEPWPKALPDQIAAVRDTLLDLGEATPEQVARRFKRARISSVQPLLDSLTALGDAHLTEEGRYAA